MIPCKLRNWKQKFQKLRIQNLNIQKLIVNIAQSQIKIIFKMKNLKKAWNLNKIQNFTKNLINLSHNNQINKLKMKNHKKIK
jgi:hypothetical protein